MNIRVIARNIGIALVFNAIMMFVSVIVSVIYNFDSSFSPLFLSGVITLTTGLFPLIFIEKKSDIGIKEGFTIVVFSWLLSCIFGMLPYVLWGGEFTLMNAWFESVSGFTTTGGTILQDIEALPKGLIFWRSATHFIGGIGVVIFMLLILPSVSTFRVRLSKMEISSLSKDNYKFKTKQTVRIIATIYFGLNLVEAICLMLAGMDWFDAVNHSFSTIATGGFSTKNLSVGAFNSTAIEMIILVFMFLSGIHFGLLYSAIFDRSTKIYKSPIVRFYFFTVLFSTIAITLSLLINGSYSNTFEALKISAFHVVSRITTTGFAIADTSVWPSFPILILLFLSIQCACSGSTTGGIKTDRVIIFWRSFIVQMKKLLHPKAVIPVRFGEQIVENSMVSAVNLYIVVYMLIMFVGAVLLSMMGMDFMDSFSASIANIGNVGPGFGTLGSLENYSAVPGLGKFILSLQMLLGRVEIYSIFIVFFIWKWR